MLIALSNFENDDLGRFQRIREICKEKYNGQIDFASVSFEDFVKALEDLPHLSKNLDDAVRDFRAYLDEEGKLPTWQRLLDVVNCAGFPDDILERNVYMCPARGGAYEHRRCKYFGMYQGKRVKRIAVIEAVVDIEDSETASLKWKNVEGKNDELIKLARSKLDERRPGRYPMRIFLLGQLFATDYRKNSPGGMQGSKRYFDVGDRNAPDAKALATALDGQTWSPELELADPVAPIRKKLEF